MQSIMCSFFLCPLLSVQRSDYLNTFEFMDKLAENLEKKQKADWLGHTAKL